MANTERLQPGKRVGVFVDGQWLYKTCKDRFGSGYCHPIILASSVTSDRRLALVRYYSGIHQPRENPALNAALQRRHGLMRKVHVHVEERHLKYRDEWAIHPDDRGSLPDPRKYGGDPVQVRVVPYRRPREKGIDLKLGLDIVDLALRDLIDVAVIISGDEDLSEVPKIIRLMGHVLTRRIFVEAAVFNERPAPVQMPSFDYTHQLRRADFDEARDVYNYKEELDRTHVDLWVSACLAKHPIYPRAGEAETAIDQGRQGLEPRPSE